MSGYNPPPPGGNFYPRESHGEDDANVANKEKPRPKRVVMVRHLLRVFGLHFFRSRLQH
jgi:hypothetical protein